MLRSLAISCIFLGASSLGWAACQSCAESALGGPADNRFTVFDAAVPEGQGLPEILVNVASLNLYLHATDLRIGTGRGFLLERSYNIDDDRSGPFGNKWSFNLGERLSPDGEGKVLTLRRGSGRLDSFAAGSDTGRFFALGRTTLELSASAPTGYTVRGGGATRLFTGDGRLTSIEQSGVRIALDYDTAGRLTAARGAGRTLQFAYDAAGHIMRVADSAGRTVEYAYTPEGYLARQTDPDGAATSYEYDDSGRLTAVRTASAAVLISYTADPEGLTITLPGGGVRTYRASHAPRQVLVSAGDDGPATVYTSTPAGLIESISDGAGNRTTHAYDAAGRRVRTVSPAGDTLRYEYNSAGNLTAITLPGGSRWTAEYDASGSPLRVVDPRGNAWRFAWDRGLLTSLTNPLGAISAATPGSLTDANGNTRSFQYDADGFLTRAADALGLTRTYEYDAAGRPAARSDPDGSVIRASYDARNRIVALTAGGATIAGRPTVERDAMGHVTRSPGVQYGYDSAGRLSLLRLPAGDIGYEYDHAGRLARVTDWLGNFALYRYTADGAVQSINISGGPMTVYQYDAGRALRALVSTGPDGVVVDAFRYTRDAAGNAIAVAAQETLDTIPTAVAATFTYDAGDRLIARDDGLALRYDARGNLAEISGPVNATFTWDGFGRLAGFNGASYTYDAAGLRAERAAGGISRRYLYDYSAAQPRLLAETAGDGSPLAYYVWGLAPLWKIDASGQAYFYHFDGEGNAVALSTSADGVVNRYRYDPRGRLAAAQEKVDNPLRARAASGCIDDGDGLLYSGAAFRFPELGLTLNATADVEPPVPDLLPALRAPGTLLLTGGPR